MKKNLRLFKKGNTYKKPVCNKPVIFFMMEQATGIGPACSAWEADILPLNYACVLLMIILQLPAFAKTGIIGSCNLKEKQLSIWSAGTTKTKGSCHGGIPAIHMMSGFRKSCCSRPESKQSETSMPYSGKNFRRFRILQHVKMTSSCGSGKGWAIIPEPAT